MTPHILKEEEIGDILRQRGLTLPETMHPEPHQRDQYNWAARHASIKERHRTVKPEYVILGDSITHCWGGDPADADRKMPRHGIDSWNSLFEGHTATNMGFGYDYVDNAFYRILDGELAGTSPRVIIVLIGTNDIDTLALTPETCAAHTSTLLQLLRATQPESKILLLGIMPRTEPHLAPIIRQTNEAYSRLADGQHIHFADCGSCFLEGGSPLANTRYVLDEAHPSTAGYEAMAAAIRPHLQRIDPLY